MKCVLIGVGEWDEHLFDVKYPFCRRCGVPLMLMHIKKEGSWVADANGHVLAPQFFREFRRKGAEGAVMSRAQFEGYFGVREMLNGEAMKASIDGVPVIEDDKIPRDEIHFYIGSTLLGKIVNLYAAPDPEELKQRREREKNHGG